MIFPAMELNDKKLRFFERTMHTPDDAAHGAARAALRNASRALIPLHRALIEAAKADYAFAYEPVAHPTQLFRLVSEHPFFAWLKPITALIVEIDELARRDFDLAEAAAVADRLDRLFGPVPDQEFASRYVPILQREVDVAVGHAAVRKAAAALRIDA
ncbi:MAG TPA: hypothetical protein VNA04_09140 [Thermoanaerobaculia bacterium]|nr:hypothetical protein [Thermoanaerobaculia bacterium]